MSNNDANTVSMGGGLYQLEWQAGALAMVGVLLSFSSSGWAGEPIRSERPLTVSVLVDGSDASAHGDTVFSLGPHLALNLGSHFAAEAFATTSLLMRSAVGIGARAYLLASDITPFADAQVAHVHYTFDRLLGSSSRPSTSLYLGAGLVVAKQSGFEGSVGGGVLRYLDAPRLGVTPRGSLTMGWRF